MTSAFATQGHAEHFSPLHYIISYMSLARQPSWELRHGYVFFKMSSQMRRVCSTCSTQGYVLRLTIRRLCRQCTYVTGCCISSISVSALLHLHCSLPNKPNRPKSQRSTSLLCLPSLATNTGVQLQLPNCIVLMAEWLSRDATSQIISPMIIWCALLYMQYLVAHTVIGLHR